MCASRVKKSKSKSPSVNEFKESSPIICNEMPEPTIAITHDLAGSDNNYAEVPLSKVEAYLTKHTNCYERTLPAYNNEGTKKDPHYVLKRDGFNRAYIDLDGYAGEMSESDFDELCDTIKAKITFGIDEPIAMMEASQYGYHKNDNKNKLSFRINFLKKHGSKSAIKHFVVTTMIPRITELLKDDIVVGENDDDQYLFIDLGVYNPKGRKMRMWNSSKDNEKRPNKLVGDASLEDTLITYIPSDSEELPEPVEEVQPPKETTEQESTTTNTSNPKDPEPERVVDVETLTLVLMGLAPKRYNNYDDFIKVGFICYNEGLPLKLWERWAKQCKRNKDGDCAKHWTGFSKGKLTQASLWKWLKEDNPTLFKELCPRRSDFWTLIGNYNHAETARFFYNTKPDAYAYHESLGWFQLLPSCVWKRYEKTPSGLMTDIWLTLKQVNKEHWDLLDPSKEEDSAKIKACATFAKQIGSKGFVDGVVSFLPANYNDDKLHKKMDESRNLFAFQNKVVDLDKGCEVRDIKPSDYVCLHTGYDYPETTCAETRQEIRDVLFSIWEDWEVVEYVITILALQLHGKKKFEEFYVWTGRGGNGKGVITEMVKRSFGDYFHSIPHDCITKRSDKKDAPNPPMAKAQGKRFLQAQEPEAEDKLQSGTIKEYTGNDEITARKLYGDTVCYIPQFGLFLQCNTIPKLTKLDGGVKRRMVIILFPNQFVECPTEKHHRKINHDLKDKITKSTVWRNEFIRMLLDKFQTIGSEVVRPKWITDHTDEYLAENDAVRSWLSEHYVTNLDFDDRHYKMRGSDLLVQFLADTNTQPHDMRADKFKTLMEMNGVPQKREGNPFNGYEWNEHEHNWVETRMPAGSYYLGIRKKRQNEMEGNITIEE